MRQGLSSHINHVFSKKKKIQCPETFYISWLCALKSNGPVSWNPGKRREDVRLFVTHPRFVFWKLHIPASTTGRKISGSSRKGSIKRIYNLSALELMTELYSGLALGIPSPGFPRMSPDTRENHEYIKKVLGQMLKDVSVNLNDLRKWPDGASVFYRINHKVMTSISGPGTVGQRLNCSLTRTEKNKRVHQKIIPSWENPPPLRKSVALVTNCSFVFGITTTSLNAACRTFESLRCSP